VLFLIAALHDPAARRARLRRADRPGGARRHRHRGAAHLDQAQPPGSVAACGASLDYMLAVLPARSAGEGAHRLGRVRKVDWTFLGLNMPTWVLMSLVASTLWASR
jgi:protein dithiol:quinone oxidoreductase